ncbi:MAG: ribonuclease T2 [Pseudomonadota bacterium]
MRWLMIWLLGLAPAWAEGERAGDFDYYVMALSWSPNFCATTTRENPQCDAPFGWVLHGLWPQYEEGWPSYCPTNHRNPSRRDTADMADIMGSPGSAWHQWNKHGRCTGLSSEDYYALSREAYGRITRPEVFRKMSKSFTMPASLIEEAFLRDNPAFEADMLTVTCKDRRIQEVRVCMRRSLEPRICGRDVIRDCTMQNALMDPIE